MNALGCGLRRTMPSRERSHGLDAIQQREPQGQEEVSGRELAGVRARAARPRPTSILAGIASVWIAFVVWWVVSTEHGSTKDQHAANLRIPRASVECVGLQMGTSPPVAALIGDTRTNDFKIPLTYFELRLLIQKCPSPEQCDTVVDTTKSIFVDVPP
jgi:hypothetical protein